MKVYKEGNSRGVTNRGRGIKPWQVRLYADGHFTYIGSFATQEEAQAAYREAWDRYVSKTATANKRTKV
jgi:hypothetical protein